MSIHDFESDRAVFMDGPRQEVRAIVSDDDIPLYQVDLSATPRSRYTKICEDFKETMAQLVGIYDEILALSGHRRLASFLARTLLKRVYSGEETAEIKGISSATGIPIHLVVAYNTFLDLFAGCMSGGAKVGPGSRKTRMLHFRNLDWGMDLLRDLIIRVEYVRNGQVVARAVTYAGYLGVLTGVRTGLSISLNYRPRVVSQSSASRNTFHYLAILLAFRPSVASQLREILLSASPPPSLDELDERFSNNTASSCYLTFCSTTAVLIIEKDLKTSICHRSDEFLAVTNHDASMESWSQERWQRYVDVDVEGELTTGETKTLLEDSIERKQCLCRWWASKGKRKATIDDVKSWLRTYPIRNEMTHYSCIMDPSVEGGGLAWVETCEPV